MEDPEFKHQSHSQLQGHFAGGGEGGFRHGLSVAGGVAARLGPPRSCAARPRCQYVLPHTRDGG